MPSLTINGVAHDVDVPGDMPLLWVIRDVVGMTGTKFGCGVAQCGACTVHLDGTPVRSCSTAVSQAAGISNHVQIFHGAWTPVTVTQFFSSHPAQ